jgi:hypothetical protein
MESLIPMSLNGGLQEYSVASTAMPVSTIPVSYNNLHVTALYFTLLSI